MTALLYLCPTLQLRLIAMLGAGVFLITALLSLGITADRATDSFVPRGHVSFNNKMMIHEVYNINDPLLVEVSATSGDIFTPQGLQMLQQVSRAIEALDGVRYDSVRSLDRHDDIIPGPDGFDVRNFLDPFPQTIEEARAIKDRIKAFPFYDGLLVSHDATTAAVVADFATDADVLETFAALRAMEAAIDVQTDGAYRLRVSGPPIVTGTLDVYLNRDAITLNPVSAVLTSLLLFLCLRSLGGVLLPLTVMLPSIMVATASMMLLGFPFNPFSNAVPVVILAMSIADSVHLMSGYYDRRIARPQENRATALHHVIAELRFPIIFTSLTTAVGFLLLCFSSPMIPVEQFGITVTVGVTAAAVFSLTMLPAMMLLFRVEPSAAYARNFAANSDNGYWPRFAVAFARRFSTSWLGTCVFVTVIAIIALAGIPQLLPDYEPAKFFPKSSSVYTDYYAFSNAYVGANFVEVDFDTDVESGVYAPDFIARLESLQKDIEDFEVVGSAMFVGDYLKKMNQAFHEGRPEYYRATGDAALNAQYLLLYTISGDPRRFDELTNEMRSRANMRVFLKSGSHARTADFMRWLEAETEARFPDETVTIGGDSYVVFNWMETIFAQVLTACLVTLAIGLVLTRSVVTAALVLLPVTCGVTLTYAYIGLAGIRVGLGTSILASVAIGSGIDFATQYLWAYRRATRDGADHATATAQVMRGVGKVIVFNALIIAGGFCVLILSQTTPPAHVGTFVAISILASLGTTFFVLVRGAVFIRHTRFATSMQKEPTP